MSSIQAAKLRLEAPQTSNENVTKVVQGLMGIWGWTQGDMAEAFGVDHSTISGKLAGRRKWSMDDVDKLSEVFGLDRSVFFRVPTEVFKELFERLTLEGAAVGIPGSIPFTLAAAA